MLILQLQGVSVVNLINVSDCLLKLNYSTTLYSEDSKVTNILILNNDSPEQAALLFALIFNPQNVKMLQTA